MLGSLWIRLQKATSARFSNGKYLLSAISVFFPRKRIFLNRYWIETFLLQFRSIPVDATPFCEIILIKGQVAIRNVRTLNSITRLFFLILQKNESFHKFAAMPINCVLASTVVFKKTPLYRCHFLQLYLFDCCRNCNAVYAKCMLQVGALNGGPEFCYRESYKCMCHCLDKHTPPEIPPFPWFTVVMNSVQFSAWKSL